MKNKVVAVSGGPDSMYLLYKMKQLNLNSSLVVAHVNYNFRKESVEEEQMVRDYCKKHNIKIEVLNVDENILSIYKNINNKQKKAREIRYDFFRKICSKYGTNLIYVAHHKDDFIETALMQQRRSNDYFFYGLKKENQIKDLIIKRTLLKKWKSQIIEECNSKKIPYMIDSSNFSDLYERNRLRKEFLNFSVEDKNDFFEQIKNVNNKNKSNFKEVKQIFYKWEENKYDINYFLIQKNDFKNNIIYMYLSKNNLNISKNKIHAILNFLEKSIKNKKFRLKDNVYILNDGKKIKLIFCER